MVRTMNEAIWEQHLSGVVTKETSSVFLAIADKYYPPKKIIGFTSPTKKIDPEGYQKRIFLELLVNELKKINIEKVYDMEVNTTLSLVKDTLDELYQLCVDNDRYKHLLLANAWNNSLNEASQGELKALNLGMVFLETAKWNDTEVASQFINAGFPINFQHPETKNTLLHTVSYLNGAHKLAHFLIDTKKCNYLIKGAEDRVAYDLAYRFNRDHTLAERLFKETEQQANDEKIHIEYRYGNEHRPK